MADLIIRDMEMPKDGRITIQIGSDGAVYFVEKCRIMAEKYEKSSHAIPLPEGHGNLIDADAPISAVCYTGKHAPYGTIYETTPYQLLCKQHTMLDSLKIIVPAEGGKIE